MTELVGGRYRLVEQVGAGGMGVVWRAYDEVVGREVAVKRVRLAPGLDAGERRALCERALGEARTAAVLRHPSIVAVHDLVADADGDPAIVMELVHGSSLEEVIRGGGPLPADRAARIGLRVLSALEAAHAAGVVHRDVKPANVLLAGDGRVVLSDFGIATLAGGQEGTPVGTPGFTAPECLLGEAVVGPASDLWSLAATVYAAVEGRGPFAREGALATIGAVLTEPPVPSSSSLWPVLRAMLDKDPARRPGAAQFRAHLEAAARGGHRKNAGLLPMAVAALVTAAAIGAAAQLLPQTAATSAPAPPPPSPPEAGRFAGLPRACDLLTGTRLLTLVPRALIQPEGDAKCTWSVQYARSSAEQLTMELRLRLRNPTPDGTEVRLAAADLRKLRDNDTAIVAATASGDRTRPTELRGVGDEAYTVTIMYGYGATSREQVRVGFRVSNLVAHLTVRRLAAGGSGLQDRAVAAARAIAEALGR